MSLKKRIKKIYKICVSFFSGKVLIIQKDLTRSFGHSQRKLKTIQIAVSQHPDL
jgi:hypothetical protein